jgi:hypothetical protein
VKKLTEKSFDLIRHCETIVKRERESFTSRRNAFVAGMVVNAVLCFNDLIASSWTGVVAATAVELGVCNSSAQPGGFPADCECRGPSVGLTLSM